MVGAPFQGWCPASEVNDGGCPEKSDHLNQKVEIEKCLLSAAAYIKDWAEGSHTKRPLKRAY
jgi:hypothetical protein